MKHFAIFVGFTMVFLLLLWGGLDKILKVILEANLFYLLLAFFVFFGSLAIWTERWKLLLGGLEIEVERIEVLKAVLMGIFMNNMTPGARGGGEPLRGYYIAKKSGKSYGQAFATIAADRVLDLVPVFTMLMLSTIYSYHAGDKKLALVIVALTSFLLLITLLSILVLTNEKKTTKIIEKLSKLIERMSGRKGITEKVLKRTKENFKTFTIGFKVLFRRKPLFLKALLLSYLFWGSNVLRTYFVFLSLGTKLGFWEIMVVQVIGTVVGILSILPGGTGIVETVTSGTYILLGIDKETAIAAILLDRIIYYWIPTLGGGLITTTSISNIRKKI